MWDLPEPEPLTARGRADAIANVSIRQAAKDGFVLSLTPETPVFPDERHTWLAERGTWGEIEALVRHWTATG